MLLLGYHGATPTTRGRILFLLGGGGFKSTDSAIQISTALHHNVLTAVAAARGLAVRGPGCHLAMERIRKPWESTDEKGTQVSSLGLTRRAAACSLPA